MPVPGKRHHRVGDDEKQNCCPGYVIHAGYYTKVLKMRLASLFGKAIRDKPLSSVSVKSVRRWENWDVHQMVDFRRVASIAVHFNNIKTIVACPFSGP